MKCALIRYSRIFALTVLLFACQPHTTSSGTTVHQRVIASGKIRCGYFDWEPLLKKDINHGTFSGIAPDIMNEVATRLGLKYEWAEEVGPSTAVESIKSKRIDMVCLPIIITNPRMRVADFTDPVLFSRFSVWVREDSSLINTDELNQPSHTFVAIDGTAPMAMTKRIFPKAGLVSLTELSPTSDMFLSLVSKKAEAVYSDTSNAGMFSKYNPGQIKPLLDNDTDRILPWAFMTPADEYQFTTMINFVLRDMQLDGTIAKIVRKHSAEKMYLPAKPRYDLKGF